MVERSLARNESPLLFGNPYTRIATIDSYRYRKASAATSALLDKPVWTSPAAPWLLSDLKRTAPIRALCITPSDGAIANILAKRHHRAGNCERSCRMSTQRARTARLLRQARGLLSR